MFFNESQITYTVISGMNNYTGSLFLTLLAIFIILLLIALILRIPMEFTGVILLPLTIVLWANDSAFLAIAGIWLIYLGMLIAKNIPIGR